MGHAVLSESQQLKKSKGLCLTIGCKKTHLKRKNYCCSCVQIKYKERHPINYAYQNLRANAKRRSKRFVITLDEFKVWCEEYKYMDGRGRGANNKTIDCKISEIGYEAYNMQVLSNADNVRKMHHDRRMMQKYGCVPSDTTQDTQHNIIIPDDPSLFVSIATAPF